MLWGKGFVGYVVEIGEIVNIFDVYVVCSNVLSINKLLGVLGVCKLYLFV